MKHISSNIKPKAQISLENQKDNFFPAKQVLTLASAHGAHDFYTGFLAPLLPILIDKLSLLKVQGGLLSSFLLWPSALQPIIGRVADRKNLKKYIFLAPAISGIFMSLLGVAPNYTILAIILLIAGINSAGFHAITPAIAGRISGNNIGKGMSYWIVGGQLAWMIGPIVITSVVSLFSVRATPWLMIGGIGASFILFFLLKNVDVQALPNNNEIPLASSIKTIAPIFLPMIGVITGRSLISSATSSFLPLYLTDQGASLLLAGTMQTVNIGSGILGTLIGGNLRDKIGGKPIIIISILGSLLFMILFLNVGGLYQIVTLILLGIFSAMLLPVNLAMVQEYSPENRFLANGLYLAIQFFIRALAGIIIGFLYDQFGGQQAFLYGAIFSIIAMP